MLSKERLDEIRAHDATAECARSRCHQTAADRRDLLAGYDALQARHTAVLALLDQWRASAYARTPIAKLSPWESPRLEMETYITAIRVRLSTEDVLQI